MTLNLECDIAEQLRDLDPGKWSALQTEVCMNVANAKLFVFTAEAERLAEFVRVRLISRPVAADYLHSAAIYNQLYYEYGADRIQALISDAMRELAA